MIAAAALVAHVVELAGTLIIASFATAGFVRLLHVRPDFDAARRIVAEGIVWALGLELAATLLKLLALHTWSQLGMFAVVFALRTLVKRTITVPTASADVTR